MVILTPIVLMVVGIPGYIYMPCFFPTFGFDFFWQMDPMALWLWKFEQFEHDGFQNTLSHLSFVSSPDFVHM